MVSVIAASAVDCGFKPRLGQTKVSKTDNCYFSAKHEGVGANNGWLGIRNVSKWNDTSINGQLFQRATTIKIQPYVLL